MEVHVHLINLIRNYCLFKFHFQQ